jgi:hypothetical protein
VAGLILESDHEVTVTDESTGHLEADQAAPFELGPERLVPFAVIVVVKERLQRHMGDDEIRRGLPRGHRALSRRR